MCYESWNERKREMEQLDKAKKEADKMIEQARTTARKPEAPAGGEAMPVAETEKMPA
jgi:F0F1-type ATP synthase membrane subunit b/b'